MRICVLAIIPLGLNAGMLAAQFVLSILLGNTLGALFKSFGSVMAGVAHAWAVINLIATFMLLYMLEHWHPATTVLGVITMVSIQRAVFALMTTFLLTREYNQDASNLAWWTGRWRGRGLGWSGILHPLREFCCKIVEASLFAVDFIAGHFILFFLSIFCLVPWMDRWHTTILFWLPPSRQFRRPIYSMRERSRRRRLCIGYGLLFVLMFLVLAALLVIPRFKSNLVPKSVIKLFPF
jgi:1,3-beta-glucan synthase